MPLLPPGGLLALLTEAPGQPNGHTLALYILSGTQVGGEDRGHWERGVLEAVSRHASLVLTDVGSARPERGSQETEDRIMSRQPGLNCQKRQHPTSPNNEGPSGLPRLTAGHFFFLLSHFIDEKTEAQRGCKCAFTRINIHGVAGWNWALLFLSRAPQRLE